MLRLCLIDHYEIAVEKPLIRRKAGAFGPGLSASCNLFNASLLQEFVRIKECSHSLYLG
jgi:hypothetical protein